MKILGIAADHGGFQLKNEVFERLKKEICHAFPSLMA